MRVSKCASCYRCKGDADADASTNMQYMCFYETVYLVLDTVYFFNGSLT